MGSFRRCGRLHPRLYSAWRRYHCAAAGLSPLCPRHRQLRPEIGGQPLKLRGDRYEMDFADLEEKMAAPENKLMLLCNPPQSHKWMCGSGRIWSE